MTSPLQQARDELAAAQRKIEALSRVPDADNYDVGTIIRWRASGSTGRPYVAVKTPPIGVYPVRWQVSGTREDLYGTWDRIVAGFLSKPLDYFEVAPDDWTDASLPPVEVTETGGNLVLTDRATNRRWTLRGGDWVRE